MILQFDNTHRKLILNEVIIIRLVLICCLVLYHSFAPYGNAWRSLSDQFILPYFWISKISYSFFLGSFVFVSGFLYAHGDLIKGEQPLVSVLKKKGKRLIVTSVIFSIIYLLIFGLKAGESISHAIYSIVEGRGHMWFLPMLFWLFIAMELTKRTKLKPSVVLVTAFILSVMEILPLPLRLDSAFQYFIFFYLGYATKNAPIVYAGGKTLIVSMIVWLATFSCIELVDLYNPFKEAGVQKIITILFVFYGRITYTIAGTVFIYIYIGT